MTYGAHRYSVVRMDHSLPSLDAFAAVLHAAETGSFSAAANALDITHGAISRRIALVEAWAGFRIFERHGRGVRLTEAGQDIAAQVETLLLQFRDIGLAGPRGADMPIVRTGVINSFARLWMIPNLMRLEGDPKDLHILLDIDSRLMPLATDRIAIRYGAGPWPASRSIPLAREMFRPYASAGLAATLPADLNPKTILSYPLIHDQYDDGWPMWLDLPRLAVRPLDRHLPGYDLTLLAAAEGLGIALVRAPYGDHACRRLGLLPVAERRVVNPKMFHIVVHNGRLSKATQRLADRIEKLFSADASVREATFR